LGSEDFFNFLQKRLGRILKPQTPGAKKLPGIEKKDKYYGALATSVVTALRGERDIAVSADFIFLA
jgi:hypothetical protein